QGGRKLTPAPRKINNTSPISIQLATLRSQPRRVCNPWVPEGRHPAAADRHARTTPQHHGKKRTRLSIRVLLPMIVQSGKSAALALSACSSGTAPTTPVQAPTAAPQRAREVYPADVVQNFMNSCTSSATRSVGFTSAQRMCGCAIEGIQKRFTLQEFSRAEVG